MHRNGNRVRRGSRLASIGLVAVMLLAACGGGGNGASKNESSGTSLPKCPLDALAKAKKPVEITFWHEMTRANEETLVKLTNQFNSSQGDVRVRLVNQTGYKEAFQKFRAGLSGGDLPDLLQMYDIALQPLIDSRAVLPMQSCVNASDYDTSDFLARPLQYYTVQKALWGMPFNVSNPIFLYDKNAFRAAGLDPDKPPSTLAQVKTAAEKIKAIGYETGYGLKLDPWYLEQWSAKAGRDYVDNGNGRRARATKVEFVNPAGEDIFAWMSDMVKRGLAKTNNADGPSEFDNLLGIRSHRNAMTIDSSATLGTIKQVLESGEGGGVELGVGPMPGPVGRGGVLVGGAALYIINRSAPEKQAAAWKYVQFLSTAESQATWAAGTGYVPTRKSAVNQPVLVELWNKNPTFRVAYDQLVGGVENSATAGPVIGDYQGVRDVVLDAEVRMLTQGKAPKAALQEAADAANAKIREYNARVG